MPMVAVTAGRIHPTVQLAIVAAFDIALLVAPTGGNIKKTAPPPRENW